MEFTFEPFLNDELLENDGCDAYELEWSLVEPVGIRKSGYEFQIKP